MAHIKRRPLKPGKNGKPRFSYLVSWIDASGKERGKSFRKSGDAGDFKIEIESALLRGTYVDPRAGDITLEQYARQWCTDRIDHRESTAERVRGDLARYAYPHIGTVRLGAARRADLQSWVHILVHTHGLAPSTVRSVFAIVHAVFAQAVFDDLIPRNPCERVVLPENPRSEVLIPSTEQFTEITSALRTLYYRRLVLTVAGTGLRSGEIRGLTEDRVDWLRRTVKVDRQLRGVVDGAPVFGPPKSAAGNRTIPVAQCVIDVMAEQIAQRGAGPGGLIFTNQARGPLKPAAVSAVLSRALDPLGWPNGTGLHLFRHYYASLLIHAGLSVKVVQKRLGHATAAETLDTYGHLWPDSDEDTRTAVAEVLGTIISAGSPSPSGVRQSVKSPSLHRRCSSQPVRHGNCHEQVAGGARL